MKKIQKKFIIIFGCILFFSFIISLLTTNEDTKNQNNLENHISVIIQGDLRTEVEPSQSVVLVNKKNAIWISNIIFKKSYDSEKGQYEIFIDVESYNKHLNSLIRDEFLILPKNTNKNVFHENTLIKETYEIHY